MPNFIAGDTRAYEQAYGRRPSSSEILALANPLTLQQASPGLLSLIKPGTEKFYERYADTGPDLIRMIAQDRVKNAMLQGNTKEAQSIVETLMSIAPDSMKSYIMGLLK